MICSQGGGQHTHTIRRVRDAGDLQTEKEEEKKDDDEKREETIRAERLTDPVDE
jgi:hypothetical protein